MSLLRRFRRGLSKAFGGLNSSKGIWDHFNENINRASAQIDTERGLTDQRAAALGDISSLQSAMDMSLDVAGDSFTNMVEQGFTENERARRERIQQLLTSRMEGVSSRRARPGAAQTRFSVGSLI